MPITANTLYRDSFNFFRNQLVSIALLALLTAFISMLLQQAFSPDAEQLKMFIAAENDFSSASGMGFQEIIQNMSPEQQKILLKISAAATFSALVGNLLLVGGVLTLILLTSQGKKVSALAAIGASAPQLPRLLLLLFVCTLSIQLGLMLFIIPGIVMAIAFSLAPVIVVADKKGVLASLKLSCRSAFSHTRVIVPAMMLWLAAKLPLLLISNQPSVLSPNITSVLLNTLSNLVSAWLLIYLFRLYMLIRDKTPE